MDIKNEDISIGKVWYGAASGKIVLRKFGNCTLKGATGENTVTEKSLDITNFSQDVEGTHVLKGEQIMHVRFSGKHCSIDLKDGRMITLNLDGQRLYRITD